MAVTYVNPRNNESPRFLVALNTHSVALDSYDLKTLALLRMGRENLLTDQGREPRRRPSSRGDFDLPEKIVGCKAD